jgi:hypothetical protein
MFAWLARGNDAIEVHDSAFAIELVAMIEEAPRHFDCANADAAFRDHLLSRFSPGHAGEIIDQIHGLHDRMDAFDQVSHVVHVRVVVNRHEVKTLCCLTRSEMKEAKLFIIEPSKRAAAKDSRDRRLHFEVDCSTTYSLVMALYLCSGFLTPSDETRLLPINKDNFRRL